MKNKRALFAALALWLSVHAYAQDASKSFPITLDHTESTSVSGGLLYQNSPGVKLTWKSAVPGLQFCVAYAGVNGVDLNGTGGQRSFQSDRTHCMVADADGLASDSVKLTISKQPNGLLLATVVLINNDINTQAVPVGKLYPELYRGY